VSYQSQGKDGFTRGVLEFTAIANQTCVVFISMTYIMKPTACCVAPSSLTMKIDTTLGVNYCNYFSLSIIHLPMKGL
jgi:hypothetical protein